MLNQQLVFNKKQNTVRPISSFLSNLTTFSYKYRKITCGMIFNPNQAGIFDIKQSEGGRAPYD